MLYLGILISLKELPPINYFLNLLILLEFWLQHSDPDCFYLFLYCSDILFIHPIFQAQLFM